MMKWEEWDCPECDESHIIADDAKRDTPVTCKRCGKRYKSINVLAAHGFVREAETD